MIFNHRKISEQREGKDIDRIDSHGIHTIAVGKDIDLIDSYGIHTIEVVQQDKGIDLIDSYDIHTIEVVQRNKDIDLINSNDIHTIEVVKEIGLVDSCGIQSSGGPRAERSLHDIEIVAPIVRVENKLHTVEKDELQAPYKNWGRLVKLLDQGTFPIFREDFKPSEVKGFRQSPTYRANRQKCNHAMAKLIRNGRALAISRELLLEDRFEKLGKLFHLQPLLNVPKLGKVEGRTCLDASVRGQANMSLNDACDSE